MGFNVIEHIAVHFLYIVLIEDFQSLRCDVSKLLRQGVASFETEEEKKRKKSFLRKSDLRLPGILILCMYVLLTRLSCTSFIIFFNFSALNCIGFDRVDVIYSRNPDINAWIPRCCSCSPERSSFWFNNGKNRLTFRIMMSLKELHPMIDNIQENH